MLLLNLFLLLSALQVFYLSKGDNDHNKPFVLRVIGHDGASLYSSASTSATVIGAIAEGSLIEAFDIVQTGDKMSFYRVGDDAWILADNVNVLPSLDGGAGDDDEIIEGKVEDTATPSTIHGDETKQHSSSGGGVANHENGSDTKKSSITTRCSGIMGRLTSKLKFNFKIPCLAMIKAQLSKLLATILYFKGQIWTKIKT
jgi:hypothetical protein